MPRSKIPLSARLFRLVLAAGGSATRAEVCRAVRRNLTRAQIDAALAECGDLLEVSRGHYKDSRRPSQRFTVTMKGWYAAQQLIAGWTPRRLPTAVLQQWHADLAKEGDPYALEIAHAFRDAAELKRLKAAGWRLPKKRAKRPEPVLPVILPPVDDTVSGGFRVPSPPPAPAAPATTRPAASVPDSFCTVCHFDAPLCRCKSPELQRYRDTPSYYQPRPSSGVQPTMQDSPSDSALAERIRKAGYQVKGDRVQHGFDQWIPIETWMQKEGWRLP